MNVYYFLVTSRAKQVMNDILNILKYVWSRADSLENINSFTGETIVIERIGECDSFDSTLYVNAQIKVGAVTLRGCVKIVEDGDRWLLWNSPHKESTILVVTLSVNRPIFLPSGGTVALFAPKVCSSLISRYNELNYHKERICGDILTDLNIVDRERYLTNLLIDRMEHKCKNIGELYGEVCGSWSDTAVYMLFDTIAVSNKVNRKLYRELARRIGYSSIIRKLTTVSIMPKEREESCKNIEALLLGTSGFLEYNRVENREYDDYTYELRERFDIIKRRYGIKVIDSTHWRFKGVNFLSAVTFQLAQLSAILNEYTALHYSIVESVSLEQLRNIFKVKCSPYWQDHISPSAPPLARKIETTLHNSKVDLMIINFIAPYLLFCNDRNEGGYDESMCDKVFSYLLNTGAEANSLVKRWSAYVDLKSAFNSQAIIQLVKFYCGEKRCLECWLGRKYLAKVDILE